MATGAGIPYEKHYDDPVPEHTYASGVSKDGCNTYRNNDDGWTESGGAHTLSFDDKSVRLGFIRKVFSIVMVQLVITGLIVALFVSNEDTNKFFMNNQQFIWGSMFLSIFCLLAMICFESARRTAPTNYIFLFIFTVCEGIMLGVISSTYKASEVLWAVGICCAICFILTVYAFQTKTDYTTKGGILLICLTVFLLGTIMISLMGRGPQSSGLRIGISLVAVLIFSFYLIYDIQLMVGGEHKYALSPEEYVFAALNIYLDIINLFIYILRIIGDK